MLYNSINLRITKKCYTYVYEIIKEHLLFFSALLREDLKR
jgi:hypothetical protein